MGRNEWKHRRSGFERINYDDFGWIKKQRKFERSRRDK